MSETSAHSQIEVTLAIPTLNREQILIDTLNDALRECREHSSLEVVVIDQSEKLPPGVMTWLQALPDTLWGRVRYFHALDFRGLPEARNAAWQQSRGQQVIYIDDDVALLPGFVSHHIQAMADPGVGVVAGGVDERKHDDFGPPTGAFDRWRCHATRGFAAQGSFDVVHGIGCNFSVRRRVLEAVDGFDERFNVGAALGEETDFCLSAGELGNRVRFDGSARLRHLAAPTGGCRVPDPRKYVHSLGHSRGMLASKHLPKAQQLTARAFAMRIAAGYVKAHRDPRLLMDLHRGWQSAQLRLGQARRRTSYGLQEVSPQP